MPSSLTGRLHNYSICGSLFNEQRRPNSGSEDYQGPDRWRVHFKFGSQYLVEALQSRTIKLFGGVMEVSTGERSIVPHGVWIYVELHGITRVVAALVVPGRTSYHTLLSRHRMHDTGIRGDYKLGTYTILGDDGNRSKLPRAGDRSAMSEPSSSSSKSPLWVTVNSAGREEDMEMYDEDSDEDISEGEVDRAIQHALRQDYHLVHENDDDNSEDYSGDTKFLSGN